MLASHAGADQLFGKPCDRNAAAKPFLEGFELYSRHGSFRDPNACEDAIPLLEEAANQCSDPGSSWELQWKPLLPVSYLPFFYLGDCRSRLNKLPDALRNLYISRCVNEPERDQQGVTKGLASLVEKCHLGLESLRRPDKHPPEFTEGFKAAEEAKRRRAPSEWERAASRMWEALQIQEDDGKNYGREARYQAPYLPRLKLGEALFHLGCYREASEQFSLVNRKNLESPAAKLERELLEKLKPKAETLAAEKTESPQICNRWRCWLGEAKRK